jgi:superoxide dismutase, Cu-Zn family
MSADRAIQIAVGALGVVILVVVIVATLQPREVPVAVQLRNAEGTPVGLALLTADPAGGTNIAVQARGLTPGEHGIHIHEIGQCDPPDFESAGNHFNPFRVQHGLENPDGPHSGDMPDLPVSRNGTVVNYQATISATLDSGKETSLLGSNGSALVVHAGEDDQMTDPAGNSGSRVACGVIAPG